MPDSFTKNSSVAHVARVVGYRRGCRFRESWYVVFDTVGRVVSGRPDESDAAPSIRYVETVGVPADWVRHAEPFSPGALDRFREQLSGRESESEESPRRYRHAAFRQLYVPRSRPRITRRKAAPSW